MEKIDVKALTDNVFRAIGTEWMLVTAGTAESFNTMTASWGCLGWLWNKPVAVVFIRPERLTHDFAERSDTLTLAFLGTSAQARRAYEYCGSHSGRDTDKMAATELKPVGLPGGGVGFAQARLVLECRKLYSDSLRADRFADSSLGRWYGGKMGGLHDVYVAEIKAAYAGDGCWAGATNG